MSESRSTDLGSSLAWGDDQMIVDPRWGNCRRGCSPSYLNKNGYCSPNCERGWPRGEFVELQEVSK